MGDAPCPKCGPVEPERRVFLLPRRDDRGWLARTPPETPFRMAVEGATPDEATARFIVADHAWRETLARRAPASGDTKTTDEV